VTADKQLRGRRGAEQIRAGRAKKTPDRIGPKQTEELAELKQLRRDGRQTGQERYRQR
jgi:hypothetical protein